MDPCRDVDNPTIPISSLSIQAIVNENCCPQFPSSAFPIYSLTDVPPSTLDDIFVVVKDAASKGMRLSLDKMEEWGPPIDLPPQWDFSGKCFQDILASYLSLFDGDYEMTSIDDPRWFPMGFLVVLKPEWQDEGGLLMVYLARRISGTSNPLQRRVYDVLELKKVPMKYPREVGKVLASLRMGYEDFDKQKHILI